MLLVLLESTLKNDNVAQTFALKHSSEDDVVSCLSFRTSVPERSGLAPDLHSALKTFPCRFLKIVPVRYLPSVFSSRLCAQCSMSVGIDPTTRPSMLAFGTLLCEVSTLPIL